ncbi:hypothetical protein ACFQGA_09360 [Marinobacter koreensis]|uniref:Uncharacterized protein n=1 Tax=Marinobacter koreensis TaxID=335974 RepID=A0ABW0RHL9_9GAMM|nr:hypothetical protein [Marinobacter koreensis]MCK7547154.1 hypothetical protein [Marinobacter koreensis]
MDEKLNDVPACEDTLVVIADIAASGGMLQRVLATGVASNRVAEVCEGLFMEIRDLAGSACHASADNDA